MMEKEQILKILKKKNIKDLLLGDLIGGGTLVAFIEKGKLKIGGMSTVSYTHRYGINVVATKKLGGTYPWFESNLYREFLGSLPIIKEVFETEDLSSFRDFDLKQLMIKW